MPAFQPKALVFDLMGTCLDWHSALLPALRDAAATFPSSAFPDETSLSRLALDWRQGFFDEIQAHFDRGEEQEDIDVTHRRVLDRLLEEKGLGEGCGERTRQKLVLQWHKQIGQCIRFFAERAAHIHRGAAWPDVLPALERLRKRFFVVVLANGTVRLELDLIRSSGLPFHALFSSELLGLIKASGSPPVVAEGAGEGKGAYLYTRIPQPDPAIYRKVLDLLQVQPEDALMVAAHAYDLRAAKQVGMKTAYIQRWTEDEREDMAKVREDVDVFVDGRGGSREAGLAELAARLGV
ncbi:hypothetical protein JCM10213_002836 [Rhodosporidiobolus nylandii]